MAAIRLPQPKRSWRQPTKGSPARVKTVKPRPEPVGWRPLKLATRDPRRKRG
jgi:hypothetical protein